MTKTFRDKRDINMKQWRSTRASFPNVRLQWKMYSFVSSVGPCMHHMIIIMVWFQEGIYYIPWMCAAYNFGSRALYYLPRRASVSSYQVQCNFYLWDLIEKMCICFLNDAKSPTMYGCALCCSQNVLFTPVLVLIIWTLQPYFTLWLSAQTLKC